MYTLFCTHALLSFLLVHIVLMTLFVCSQLQSRRHQVPVNTSQLFYLPVLFIHINGN